jgi:thiamine pyrophosphate-dependent acetolactate synthase large subunit-like protein
VTSVLRRRALLNAVLEGRSADLLVVSSLGSPTWDLAAAGDNARNFGFIGAMGQAVPFALGLALARRSDRVLAVVGDGELLMSLGVLATVANQAPANLAILVLDNEVYGETGGQPTATAGRTDLELVARACGIETSCTARVDGDVKALRALLLEASGPVFASAKVDAEELPLAFPHSFDGATSLNRFRDAVLERGVS